MFSCITAGILISLASIVYANCPNSIVGSFLFSLALVSIIRLGLKLFTSMVGNCGARTKDIVAIVYIFIGNIIGSCFSFLSPSVSADIVMAKLSHSAWQVLFGGIVCGFFVYLTSLLDFDGKNMFATIMCVMAFMLGGGEHSIADICFIFNARYFTKESFLFIVLVIIGNVFGAKFCRALLDECVNEVKNNGKKVQKETSRN